MDDTHVYNTYNAIHHRRIRETPRPAAGSSIFQELCATLFSTTGWLPFKREAETLHRFSCFGIDRALGMMQTEYDDWSKLQAIRAQGNPQVMPVPFNIFAGTGGSK